MFSEEGHKNIFEVRRKRKISSQLIRIRRRKRGSFLPMKVERREPTPNLSILSIQEAVLGDIQTSDGEIFIVGGGPSLVGFGFSSLTDKCTLAVNKSVFHIPNLNYFISVDYTFLRKVSKEVFNSIRVKKFFVADFSYPSLKEVNGQITDTRYDMTYDLRDYNVLIRARKQEGIGYTFDDFRTGRNSGFCALQLAVIFGFRKIYLLGMDLNQRGKTHYHEGYGERVKTFVPKLDKYYDYFKIGLEQLHQERPDIQVVSCSPISRLNDVIPFRNFCEVV